MSTTTSPQQVDPKDPSNYQGEEMTLIDHLAELRNRLIKVSIAVVLGMVFAFVFIRDIIQALADIVPQYRLQAIDPTETFSTYMKVAFVCGLGIAMPLIVYQLFAFVSPGLTSKERGYIIRALPFVMIMFVCGVAFGYFLALPPAITFLFGLGGSEIEKNPRISTYANFVINLLLWLGVAFETPVLVYMLIKTNLVTHRKLAGLRRYAVIVILIAAAIITPTPDPGNLMIVAIPMYLLFELGLILGRFF